LPDVAVARRRQHLIPLRGGLSVAGDLCGDAEDFLLHEIATLNEIGEGLAFDELHDEVIGADVVERANVGVIESGDGPGFAGESGGELGLRDFDGDGAPDAGVGGFPDLAHAARAKRREDLVGPEFVPEL